MTVYGVWVKMGCPKRSKRYIIQGGCYNDFTEIISVETLKDFVLQGIVLDFSFSCEILDAVIGSEANYILFDRHIYNGFSDD